MKDWYCAYPFLVAQVNPGGHVDACCATWLQDDTGYLGNLENKTLLELWNGDEMRDFRSKVTDGSYSYCRKDQCPTYGSPSADIRSYEGGKHAHLLEKYLADDHTEVKPTTLSLQYDPSCNLSCPSCRFGVEIAQGSEIDKTQKIHDNVFDGSIVPETITMCGSGEAIVSPVLRPFLMDYDKSSFSKAKVGLLTNGTTLNKKLWDEMGAADSLFMINVSIDAGSRAVFEKVRRGGKWDVLIQNMEFYSTLIAEGEIEILEASFTLQKRNYRDLYNFFDLCDRYGVSSIRVNTVVPIGEFEPPDEFAKHAVHIPRHAEFPDLCEVLLEDRFVSQERVYYSSAFDEIRRDPVAYTRQYYEQLIGETQGDLVQIGAA